MFEILAVSCLVCRSFYLDKIDCFEVDFCYLNEASVTWHSGASSGPTGMLPDYSNQGCGVGVGLSTWRVGVAENFNDSGQTFCSPIVTVCATNVRKRHTWQFKQLDASTRDDHGYLDRRQRTNLYTFTQGPFQISSVPWVHHATYTFPFAHSGWHYRCSVTLATQQWMRVLMVARPLLRNSHHKSMITLVNPPRLRLIHISPSYQTVYRSFEIILEWGLSVGLEFKSNVLCKPIASKKHSIWY